MVAGTDTGMPVKEPKRSFIHLIFLDWCKRCGICVAFCPKKVFERDKTGAPVVKRPDDCIGCRFCEIHCPDFAITITEDERGARLGK